MTSPTDPAVNLARRLRGLREHAWPDVQVTQRDLARALGGTRSLSVPLISSWESQQRPVVPPVEHLQSYAAFFATRRSVESLPYRQLDDVELTQEEREQREQLERELLAARTAAMAPASPAPAATQLELLNGPWRFNDGKPITIMCSEVVPEQRAGLPEPDDPERSYADLYSFADADSLLELYGHIRASNPLAEVKFMKASSYHKPDDYTTHLVLLGGLGWNDQIKTMVSYLNLPVQLESSSSPLSRLKWMYRVDTAKGDTHDFHPEWDRGGRLLSDIGHFVRTPNPFNAKRTLTICNGIDSRGVLGTVRALADERFRERNSAYVQDRFAGRKSYSMLTRIRIFEGAVLTPDWTKDETRLHEWPESS